MTILRTKNPLLACVTKEYFEQMIRAHKQNNIAYVERLIGSLKCFPIGFLNGLQYDIYNKGTYGGYKWIEIIFVRKTNQEFKNYESEAGNKMDKKSIETLYNLLQNKQGELQCFTTQDAIK
jgi:hypothetical protein